MKWRKNIIDKKANPEFNDMIVGQEKLLILCRFINIIVKSSRSMQENVEQMRQRILASVCEGSSTLS